MREYSSPEADRALGHKHSLELGDRSWPAAFLVHGRAGDRDRMWIFRRCLPREFNIICPEAPEPDEVGGYSWWGDSSRLDIPGARVAASKLKEFVTAATDFYGFSAPYLMAFGFSQGAGILSIIMQSDPALFRGVALLSGFVIPINERGKGSLPKIFIGHGTKDPVVTIERCHEGIKFLESLGAEVEAHEEAVAHKIGVNTMRALTQWSSQKVPPSFGA